MKDFPKSKGTPGVGVPYEGKGALRGRVREYCWNGDPMLPSANSRLHYNTMHLPKIMEQISKTAPAGADVTS